MTMLSRFLSSYGMLLVLLLLCAVLSLVTLSKQQPAGESAGAQVAADILARYGADTPVLIVVQNTADDAAYADRLVADLAAGGAAVVETVRGEPPDARQALERAAGGHLQVIAATPTTASWQLITDRAADFPTLQATTVVQPQSYWWPQFLTSSNLLNVAHQISIIAIVAVGMTLVIITGGIDLSVGSLIALGAVISTLLIREVGGAREATPLAMVLSGLGGILVCGLAGALSGVTVTFFRVPSFIVTLTVMLVARGIAMLLTGNESVYEVPASFVWLGGGATLGRIPNAVVLMGLLYALAHVLMSRTVLGRYLYAVGGNAEAARLSGLPVALVLLFAYTMCGLLAGLGGVVMASQLKSAAASFGKAYELYVIAAVVVGGASLSGGRGKVLGTLVGAFIIAVIQNGMNLIGVKPEAQDVVLGLVILTAVLLDTMKQRGWLGGWRARA
jgi:ribose transport system permease protein